MTRWTWFVVLAIVLVATAAETAATKARGSETKATIQAGQGRRLAVVGYVPEYRYETIDWTGVSERVTHVILFSLEVGADGSVAAQERFPDAATYAAARAATRRTGARLLVCFGGHGRSRGFGAMATQPALRHAFVRNVGAFLDAHDLDGVDLNWERPRTRTEWAGLWALVAELADALHARGRVLTMAAHPGDVPHLPRAALTNLDLVLVMAYDAPCDSSFGNGNSKKAQQQQCSHSPYALATAAIDVAARAKVPLAKLALGVPFYARDVRTGAAATYADLVREHGVDARPGTDHVAGWGYNGPRTLARKTRLAHARGLAGLMVWELGQDVRPDARGSLLAAIDTEVRRLAAGPSVTTRSNKDEL